MISVVIPLYNKRGTVARAIHSVLSQSFRDFEIVIVNDGSTDNSVDEVERISDPRIRLINQANAGVSAARNKGIEEARGEYVALLDADDEWNSEYLATQMRLTEAYPQCAVFAVNYQFCDANGKITDTIIRNLPFTSEHGVLSNYFEVASTSHPPMWTSAVMARKKAFLGIGGFPIGIKSGEDLLTWARLACRYKIAYSRKVCATFNVEGYDVKEKPKRVPAEIDIVGEELERLAGDYNPREINRYISHWHKMRSSIYLRLNMRKQSIKEALTGLRFQPTNYKLLAFIALNLIPSKLRPF